MGAKWSEVRQEIVPVAKQSWTEFQRHNAQWLAAALAYFAAFAIAPLIIVFVEIAGLVIHDHQRVLNLIFGYLQRDAGGGAGAVKQIVAATFNEPRKGIVAEIIGWIVFIIAAVGLFGAVQFALNTVWDVTPQKKTLKQAIRQRASSFGVMLGIALLLLISMGVNAVLTIMSAYLTQVFPGFATLMKIADFALSFAVLWGAFALLYEYLPECKIEWRDVWVGSAVTSFLFVVGQFLLGWYLGRAGVSSGYGAFGSLVVFLIWVNYSGQIVLFGAEVTQVYAQRYGSLAQSRGTRGEITYRTTSTVGDRI
ncbi:MAG TPA: YihY/virulence factor BrkB family protein [Candidatus Baltobacteraceae bacterium]|nr:YihY/virulence factor BrkB family protein [Candidatus Baltobacteraceae bacterium]